jgi:hypothetical protein
MVMSKADVANVHQHLERLEPGNPSQIEAMRALWIDEYVPLIKTVDARSVPLEPRGLRLRSRDADDLALAQQSRLVAADHLVTRDKDLHEFAIADEQWTKLAAAVKMVVTQQGVLVQIVGMNVTMTFTLGAVAAVVFEGASALFQLLITRLRTLPPIVLVLGSLALLAFTLHPARRNTILKFFQQLPSNVRAIFDDLVVPYINSQTQSIVEAKAQLLPAKAFLEETRTPKLFDRSVRGFAARTLVRYPEGLDLERLVQQMHKVGYSSTAKQPHAYVRRVLRRHHELFALRGERWVLRLESMVGVLSPKHPDVLRSPSAGPQTT